MVLVRRNRILTHQARLLLPVGLALALTFAICLLSLEHPVPAKADPGIRYVSATDATCGGQSPCYTSIQAALDNALNNDIIKVATGVYTGVHARLVGTRVLTQVVLINKSVLLQGGYTTTDWSHSFPLTRPTVIDAQGKGRGVYVAESISATIEGFTITNGNASGLGGNFWYGYDAYGYDAGGGVFARNADLTLRNNVLFSNTSGTSETSYGGGLYVESNKSHMSLISGNLFISNTSGGWGGGLALLGGKVSVVNNIIENNRTLRWGGGGLFQQGSKSMIIAENLVEDNSSPYAGGGMYIFGWNATVTNNAVVNNWGGDSGGGMHLNADRSIIISNTILSNTAVYGGGIGMYLSEAVITGNLVLSNTAYAGGGIYARYNPYGSPALYRNTIRGNSATEGGGVGIGHDSRVTLAGDIIISNSATRYGGGLRLGSWLDSSIYVMLDDCIINDNIAGVYGGGLYVYSSLVVLDSSVVQNNSAGGSGGGLWIEKGSVFTVTNSVIANNHANSVAGVLYVLDSLGTLRHSTIAANTAGTVYDGVVAADNSAVWLTNTICVSHSTGLATTGSNVTLVADRTLWWATNTYTDNMGGGLILSTGDLTGDPAFVGGGNYHITPASAALDNGVDAGVTTDIDGESRPSDAGFDIGADELYRYKVALTPNNTSTVQPGSTVTYLHSLTNLGYFTDTYHLTYLSSRGWGQLVTASPVTLSPGASSTLIVRVSIPYGIPGGSSDTTYVTATSQAIPNLSVTATDVTIASWYSLYLPVIMRNTNAPMGSDRW